MTGEKDLLLPTRLQNTKPLAKASFISRRPLISLVLCVATFTIISLSSVAVVEMRAPRTLPTSSPRTDVTLGIALTPTYGTVAVRDYCGELQQVLKVQGNEEYISLMKRLSDPQSRHPSEPYRGVGEVISDWPRQALRRSRKAIGLPASGDIGTLAAMIKDLKAGLLSEGHNIETAGAVLAFPAITALYEEDARDALEYLDMPNLTGTHVIEHVPYAIDAAFRGYGYGRCENWRDKEMCRKEHNDLPGYRTLLVDYSCGALTIDIAYKRVATGNYVPPSADVDFSAGSDGKTPDNAEEWRRYIRDRIREWVSASAWSTVDLVLLTGESASDPDFTAAVEDAVSEYGPDIRLADEPEFVAALGVSEMAYRSQAVM